MDISLVIPIFNACPFLAQTLADIDAELVHAPESWELILVVDASPDYSAEICRRFAAQTHPYTVMVLVNERNIGKGASIKRGMLAATGALRIFTDCDLAYPMSEVRKIISALHAGHDVAIVSRVHADSRYTISPKDFHYLYTRHLASRFSNWVIRRTLIPECSDVHAGLKGFTARAAAFLFSQLHLTRFSFDLEILYLAHHAGLSITEVPIHFRYREEQTTVDFLNDAVRLVRDLIRVRYWSLCGTYAAALRRFSFRKLVIHADDFGLSDGVVDGVIAAIKKGAVTSTSLLVNLPSSGRALKLAYEHHLDVGWHINLTLGTPVTSPALIPSLVRPDGHFYSLWHFLLRLSAGRIAKADVERELAAQWQCFARAHLFPSHVDGHQHIHLFPIVRHVVRDLIKRHRIPFVRISRDGGGNGCSRIFARLFLRSLPGTRAHFWKESGARSIPFFGVGLSEQAGKMTAWKKLLSHIEGPTAEVMVHPSLARADEHLHGDRFPGDRNAEWDLLVSPSWQTMIQTMGFQLVGFRDLLSTERRP